MRRNLRLGLAIAIGCAVSSSCAVRDVTLDPDDAELPDSSSSGSGGAGMGGSSGAAGKGGQDAGGAAGQAADAGPDALPDGAGGTFGEDADASVDGSGGAEVGGAGGQDPDASDDADSPDDAAEAGEEAEAGPNCSDDTQNGDETGVDCGGSCPSKCGLGGGCETGADCQSSWCSIVSKQCVASQCEDDQQNGNESDTDCGAGCATKCAEGQACITGADCASASCNLGVHKCVDSACHDGQKSGDESDVDCGGSCSAKCINGKACFVGADCSSTFCNVASYKCVASQCLDAAKDGSETDVDCGGGTCPGCATGHGCKVGADCTSSVCNIVTLKCVSTMCEDGLENGSETDVDCGGACPLKCVVGKGCLTGGDCASTLCHASSKVCVSTQCEDGTKNGAETDVDCGGSCPMKCGTGQACVTGSDCSSTFCNASSKVCVASQCLDGIKNGTETDLDCGGSCATKCSAGQACLTGGDCASSSCHSISKLCVASQCLDGAKNGSETDVDCGGACSTKCATGAGCLVGSDCASTFCNSGSKQCVASQCLDGVKNGTETDVDCGGSCAAKCGTGQACLSGGDCASTICQGQVCVVDPCSPDPCNGHGSCSGGTCVCQSQYSGGSCSTCADGYSSNYPTCAPLCSLAGVENTFNTGGYGLSSVTRTGSGYAVAWEATTLMFATLDVNGVLTSGPTSLFSGSKPTLANARNYIPARYGLTFGGSNFRCISETGIPEGNLIQLRGTGATTGNDAMLTYNDNSHFGVAWTDDRSGGLRIYFNRIDVGQCTLAGQDTPISPVSANYPSVAAGDGWAVVWRASSGEVYLTRLDQWGAKLGDTQVGVATNNSETPRVAYLSSNGTWAVLWTDRVGGKEDLYLQRVSTSGALVGAKTRVTDSDTYSRYEQMVSTTSQLGVFYASSSGARFIRLSDTGQRISPLLKVAGAVVGDIASDSTSFMTVYQMGKSRRISCP